MRGVQGDSVKRGVKPEPENRTCSRETLSERPLAPLVPDELAVWAEWQCDIDPVQYHESAMGGERRSRDNGDACRSPYGRKEPGWESRRSLCSLGRRSYENVLPRVHCHKPAKMNQSKSELAPNILVKPYPETKSNKNAINESNARCRSKQFDLFCVEGGDNAKQKLAVVRPRTRANEETPPTSCKWRSEEALPRPRRKNVSESNSPEGNCSNDSPNTRWRSEDILQSRTKRTPPSQKDIIAELSDGDQTISLRLVEAEPFSEASTVPIGQCESPSPSAGDDTVIEADGGGGGCGGGGGGRGGDRTDAGERFEGAAKKQQHFLHANTCAFTAAAKDSQVANGKKMIGQDYLSPTWSVRPMLDKSDTPLLPQDSVEVEAGCMALPRRCWRCCRAKADYCHGLCLNCPGFWSILFLLIDIPCAFCFC